VPTVVRNVKFRLSQQKDVRLNVRTVSERVGHSEMILEVEETSAGTEETFRESEEIST